MLFATDLPTRKILNTRGRPIGHAYFPESGIISIVATAGSQHAIEVGVIGREGMLGMTLILGANTSPFEAFMQAPGHGWRIASADLAQVLQASPTLRSRLMLFGHVFHVQMGYSALCDGRYKLDERLARWLLMALDRLDGNVVSLTHEFLSLMLGVRRPGVTVAINKLQSKGIIDTARGIITVLDRGALNEAANGAYGAAEAEFERYLGQTAV